MVTETYFLTNEGRGIGVGDRMWGILNQLGPEDEQPSRGYSPSLIISHRVDETDIRFAVYGFQDLGITFDEGDVPDVRERVFGAIRSEFLDYELDELIGKELTGTVICSLIAYS